MFESNTETDKKKKGCSGSSPPYLPNGPSVWFQCDGVFSNTDYSPESERTSCHKQKTDDQAWRYLQHYCFAKHAAIIKSIVM